MKKLTRFLAAGAAAVLLCCGGAMAAQRQIAVELNGQTLTFTDALPQVRQERTFLPFRAVFEAMGASVSWSPDAPDAVSASRDGVSVTMTLGSPNAVVEREGKRTALTMDVAPFAENGRTYVPVRFAAQAFGCVVGWDQEAYTAILVDVDRLMEDAGAGKSYTWLEKYVAYAGKYNTGVWKSGMTLDGAMVLAGMELPMKGTVNGVVSGGRQMEMEMDLTMDMTTLSVLGQYSGNPLSAGSQATVDAMKKEGVHIAVRGDQDQNTLYMNSSGAALRGSGLDPNVWYSMDMDSSLARMGMPSALMAGEQTAEDFCKSAARMFLGDMTPPSVAANSVDGGSYPHFLAMASSVAHGLSDACFVLDGDRAGTYVDQPGRRLALELTLRSGAVAGYGMSLTASSGEGTTTTTLSVDGNDRMTGHMSMDMGGAMGRAELDLAGAYTPGGSAPRTTPPQGAAVQPYQEPAALK